MRLRNEITDAAVNKLSRWDTGPTAECVSYAQVLKQARHLGARRPFSSPTGSPCLQPSSHKSLLIFRISAHMPPHCLPCTPYTWDSTSLTLLHVCLYYLSFPDINMLIPFLSGRFLSWREASGRQRLLMQCCIFRMPDQCQPHVRCAVNICCISGRMKNI